MQDVSALLIRCISFIRDKYNLSIDRVSDDAYGAVIWLSSQNMELVVSYETEGAELYIELKFAHAGKKYKIPLDHILWKNRIRYPAHQPRTADAIEADVMELAQLLDAYAEEGLRGNPDFFQQYGIS